LLFDEAALSRNHIDCKINHVIITQMYPCIVDSVMGTWEKGVSSQFKSSDKTSSLGDKANKAQVFLH
jgi:hypothetical protein